MQGFGGGGAGLGGAIFVNEKSKMTVANTLFLANSAVGGHSPSGVDGTKGQGVGSSIFNHQGNVNLFSYYGHLYNGVEGTSVSPVSGVHHTFFDYNGSIYSLTSSLGSWREANAESQALGGTLVTINDAIENRRLFDALKSSPDSGFWIGSSDRYNDQVFEWSNGEISSFSNYSTGTLGNIGKVDYASIDIDRLGQWALSDGVSSTRRGLVENKYYQYKGAKYLLSGVGTWDQVRLQAASMGGQLVTMEVKTTEEQNWLRGQFGAAEFWSANSNSDPILRKGIIEIKQFDAIGATQDSQYFSVAKPTAYCDVAVTGGSGVDIFNLTSYAGLKTSQKVYGGKGADIFNVSIDSISGIVGLNFNAGKLKNLTDLIVYRDPKYSEMRNTAELSFMGAKLGVQLSAITAKGVCDIFEIFAKGTTAIVKTAIDFSSAMLQYGLEMGKHYTMKNIGSMEYQSKLASIGNFFDGQSTQWIDDINVLSSRSLIEIKDFNPGVDMITLPMLRNNQAYSIKAATTNDGDAYDVYLTDQTNATIPFMRLFIDPSILADFNAQVPSKTEYLRSLIRADNSHIAAIGQGVNNSAKVSVLQSSYSGGYCGDFIMVSDDNKNDKVVINGLNGDDMLLGSVVKASILNGDRGDDVISPGSVLDVVRGGDGYDRVDFIQLQSSISLEFSSAGVSVGMDVASVEAFAGTVFNDLIDLRNTGQPLSGASSYALYGGQGDDRLFGSKYHDFLYGGDGVDSLAGGLGDDIYQVDGVDDTIVENVGEGVDTVLSYVSFSMASLVNVEDLTLAGIGNIDGTGNDANNEICGNTGNNKLNGGVGADTLNGGAGADILTGGSGNDRFVLSSLKDSLINAMDEIKDFMVGIDSFDGPTAIASSSIAKVSKSTLNYSDANVAATLTTSNFTANGAAMISFADGNYLAINDGTAG